MGRVLPCITLLTAINFIAFLVIVIAYLLQGKNSSSNGGSKQHAIELHESWNGVNEIDCNRLIGPDVTKAARAMAIRASSWIHGFVDKKIIIENHFDDFKTLYNELILCDKIVPGFENKGLKCKDVISKEIKKAYKEMVFYNKGGKTDG